MLERAAIPATTCARPWTSCTAPRRSARRCCCPPATASRSTPTSPRFHAARRRDHRGAGAHRRPAGRRPGRPPLRALRRSGRRAPVLRRRPASTRWSSASRRSSASCARPTPLGTEAGLGRQRAARPGADRAARRQAGAHRHRHRPGRRIGRLGRARPGRRGARRARRAARADRRRRVDGRARRRHAAPPRRRPTSSLPTARPTGPSGWPPRSAAGRRRSTTLAAEIAAADLLVSSTGATGLVSRRTRSARAAGGRSSSSTWPLPRDVDPAVGRAAGRHLRRPRRAAQPRRRRSSDAEIAAATAIVAEELAGYLSAQQQLAVAPTVTALRARANQVVEAELARLYGRLPELDDRPAPRGRRRRAPRGREGAARADRAGEGTGRHAGRRPVRRRAARAVRPRPGRGRGRRRGQARARRSDHDCATRSLRVRHPRQRARAQAQTGLVIDALGMPIEIVPIVTEGDRVARAAGPDRRHRRVRLRAAAGAAGRRDRRRRALVQGPADRARPTASRSPPSRPRDDPRDALVARDGLTLGELPAGARVGTGSPRRAAQLRALGLGLRDRRHPRQRRHPAAQGRATARFDAVVLAYAGLRRLGRADEVDRGARPDPDAAGARAGRAGRGVPRRRRRDRRAAGARSTTRQPRRGGGRTGAC